MVKAKDKALIYNNCDIPAHLFFDELMHGNIYVLGIGSPELLYSTYMSIIDEYCELSENAKMISWFKKQNKLSQLQRQISDIQTLLNPIKYLCSTKEEFTACIALLNALERPKIKFDINKPLNEETERVEKRVIGVLNNEINTLISSNEKAPERLKKDFMQRLVSVQNILGYVLPDDVTLRKFVFLEKAAMNKINAKKK